ncbi:MAG: DUF4405 domain-containing protein [Gammaproteobacteria bacterium]|nr:DUF4405 domain-containing protein [Gammaproteobacteria bacterium]
MKISTTWATPLTIGAFAVMAVTGLLMFFHADTGLNKTAHEWLGWVMVAGVALHAVANWRMFRKYFVVGTASRVILASSCAVLLGSFASFGSGGRGSGPPPHVQALKAVTAAPLTQVAGLTGKPAGQLLAELRRAGIHLPDAAASLDSALAGDRELEGRAIGVLFAR